MEKKKKKPQYDHYIGEKKQQLSTFLKLSVNILNIY